MIVVYTQNYCPLCDRLKEILKEKNIEYTEEKNIDVMLNLGIKKTPMIKVDDSEELLNFKSALEWLNEKK